MTRNEAPGTKHQEPSTKNEAPGTKHSAAMQTVKKIEPARYQTFDQQFWPVVVALTVLCGIGIGAIVALLHGPWLWGSLLLLPTLVALTLVWLYRLDDTRLRRSLQLSIIVSLALHLLLIVVASATSIFHSLRREAPQTVAQQVPRTIEISDRRASFVWEEPNRQETPEPIVEEVRKQPPTTDVKPQPVLVEELAPSPSPELVRRETPAETVPRLDRDRSELRRQSQHSEPRPRPNRPNETPQLAELLSAAIIETAQPTKLTKSETDPQPSPASEPAESQTPTESTAAEVAIKRSAAREPSIEKTKPVPRETTPTVQLADASPPPTPSNAANEPAQLAPARASMARALRTAAMPNLAHSTPTETQRQTQTSTDREVRAEPAPAATEITRRLTPRESNHPSVVKQTEAEQRSAVQLAESAQRRPTEMPLPSISSEVSSREQPRRSAVDAELAMTTAPLERPSLPAESEALEALPNPRATSVSRSTTGTAGVGRAQNLEAATGGATSPAVRPSDSAARAETQSQRSELRQLVAAESPSQRRSAQLAPAPSSALKAEVSIPTNVAGGPIAAEQTLESSAARLESARSENRSQVSVEKGSANVDLGPTKVLPEPSESPRRSGGGQTEVSQFNPDPALRSRASGLQQPSLLASSAQVTLAPSTQSSAPTSSDLEPNASSTAISKAGGQAASTLDRDTAIQAGEISDSGKSQRVADLTASQPLATRGSADAREEGNVTNQPVARNGRQRQVVSAAPNLKGESGLSNLKRPVGESLVQADQAVETMGEALTEVARESRSAMGGLGVGKTSTSQATESISREMAEVGTAPRRSDQPGVSDLGKVALTNPALTENRRRRDSRLAGTAPQPNLNADAGLSALPRSASTTGDSTEAEGTTLAPASVELARDEVPRSEQGMELPLVALEGSPGLSKIPSDALGSMARPSDKESLQVQPSETRFRNPKFGSKPAINPDAVVAQEAFRNRTSSALLMASEPSTEASIQLGLQFLIRFQNPDGSWSLGNFDRDHPQQAAQLNSDAAATGLALLVFQGAGYNHREFKHALVVRRGIYWLIENQQEDGCLYVVADKQSNESCRMYSHGIATLALTEAYGMTQDPKLKEPAQRAIDYIVNTQDARKGGWRYFEDPNSRSTDTSVSGWMMMALHSGRLVNLKVDEQAFAGINRWLDVAVDPDDPAKYRYNPYAVDADGISRIQGKRPTPTMTAVGLLMRIYGGMEASDPTLVSGANWLVRDHRPADLTPEQRDTYYWYYATQVLKYVDGPLWETWDQQLRPLLIQSQIKTGELAGSWHPYNPIPDRWGALGGRLYVTTMNLLSLEVRHRMLPLYQRTNPSEGDPKG